LFVNVRPSKTTDAFSGNAQSAAGDSTGKIMESLSDQRRAFLYEIDVLPILALWNTKLTQFICHLAGQQSLKQTTYKASRNTARGSEVPREEVRKPLDNRKIIDRMREPSVGAGDFIAHGIREYTPSTMAG
jgi:hypothetical protein